jgi:hypothetical protein
VGRATVNSARAPRLRGCGIEAVVSID